MVNGRLQNGFIIVWWYYVPKRRDKSTSLRCCLANRLCNIPPPFDRLKDRDSLALQAFINHFQFSLFNCQLFKHFLCVLAPWRETFSRCDDRISLGVWSSCSARDLKASKAFRILFERSSNHQYFNAVAIALKQCCNVVEMSYLFNAPVILTETKNPINSSRMVQQIPHSVSEWQRNLIVCCVCLTFSTAPNPLNGALESALHYIASNDWIALLSALKGHPILAQGIALGIC